jgi:L-aminopeptidase/D-esterase-like protein
MVAYEFKAGTGTASRVLDKKAGGFTVGVVVQANCGRRPQFTVAGVPVGKAIPEGAMFGKKDDGSIIIVVATDAPLLPHQLKRVARRASHGLARTGSTSGNGSGDLFIAFSTANPGVATPEKPIHSVQTVPNDKLDPIFDATVQAVEEAIINSIVAGRTMKGADNHEILGLPHDRLRSVLAEHNRRAP